jgi:GT2 family glycosyltransferase
VIIPEGMYKYRIGEIRQVGWISGSCMLFYGKVLKEIGGLNEELVFYGEEVEIGYRLKQKGYKIFILPHLKIIHFGGMSDHKSDTKKDIANYLKLQELTIGYFHAFSKGFIVLLYRLILIFISIFIPKLSLKKCLIIFKNELVLEYNLLQKLIVNNL